MVTNWSGLPDGYNDEFVGYVRNCKYSR